jgi:hypothetical protein
MDSVYFYRNERSGGFGTFLLWGHDWAGYDATVRSYELIARHVMPHFQRYTTSLVGFPSADAGFVTVRSAVKKKTRNVYCAIGGSTAVSTSAPITGFRSNRL